MARKAKPKDADSGMIDIGNAKEMVRNAVPRIISLKNDRKAINDEINSLRSDVKAAGIPKGALDLAIKVREMDPEDRTKFDDGFQIARSAIGLTMQADLFSDDGDEDDDGKGKSAMDKARAHLGVSPDALN